MKEKTAPKIIGIIGPDERDITRANSRQPGWEDRFISLVSSREFKIGVPLIGGVGLVFGAGDLVEEVSKNIPGVHRNIAAGKLFSSLDLDVQKAEAGDPPVDPSHTPSPDDQPHDPSSPTPHPTEPTPTPTRTPEPTPTRTPEPTPTRTPEPTPTATPLPPTPELRGALKVMKVHDKDAGGDVDFGEEGLPQGFNVDGPGANDFRMQTNAAKTPETGAVVAAVVPGQYTVCEDERPGWFETTAQRCKTVIVGAFQVAHVLFFNKQIEAPPPPPPQPPVEKKFVPTPEIPKVCVLPDGREVPLPAEFQAKLFGKDAQTIARMLEEFKCEFLGHDAEQTQQHEEIKQQIKEHDDKMDVQHTEQDKAHDAISDRLKDVWNKIKGLGRGFWDWADTVGIYAGPAALAALVIWRTRRRDQQPLAQPEGEQAQEPPAPEVIAEAVVAEPAGGVVVAEGQAPAQLELEPENVNVLASVLLELVNAITDEQLQTVVGRFTPEQLDHVRAVLYRMNVPNAMDLAPLAVMRVTRDTINRLPPEQRARIQRRVEEIVQERQVQQKQAVPPAAAEALQRPEQPQAAEAPVGAGQPPVTERPAETTPRVRRRISFNIGGIGRRYVQVGSTFTNARGVVYRVVEYTPDGRLFTLARTGQTEPVRYNKDRMERLMTEHFQRGQGPAQAGQAAAGV